MKNYEQCAEKFEGILENKLEYGYTRLDLDYNEVKPFIDTVDSVKKPSNLKQSLCDLIELIFNKNLMEKQFREIGYNAAKLPLGKLSTDTLQKGYAALSRIEEVLAGKEKGDLYELTSEFYSHIPHSFGFKYYQLI